MAEAETHAVYAVLRVRDASGECDIQVGDHRYLGVFLYKPKAVAVRDRLYLRLLASDAVDSTGFTRLGVDIAGVVVATDAYHQAQARAVLRSARFTLRVTTVQRGGVDVSPAALLDGCVDERTPALGARPPRMPAPVSARLALPSLDDEPVAPARAAAPAQGTLAVGTIADLVARLVRQGRPASIEVQHEHGLGGSIFVEGGEVVAAWAGAARGVPAVLQLASYVGASYRVQPGCTTVMRNVDEPADVVLRALRNAAQAPLRGAVFTDEPTLEEFERTSQPSWP